MHKQSGVLVNMFRSANSTSGCRVWHCLNRGQRRGKGAGPQHFSFTSCIDNDRGGSGHRFKGLEVLYLECLQMGGRMEEALDKQLLDSCRGATIGPAGQNMGPEGPRRGYVAAAAFQHPPWSTAAGGCACGCPCGTGLQHRTHRWVRQVKAQEQLHKCQNPDSPHLCAAHVFTAYL